MTTQTVRVRFAPSPTGYLHIGGARTALFNWLFARANSGKFILRIEDTDLKRSKEEYLNEIISSLKWLGLDWDEGPYYQRDRIPLYLSYADRLLEKGLAYRDGNAIIFKVPPERITIDDVVHGKIEIDNSLIGELVLMKSDGSPAFNFACVVDDIEMRITHIIRGDDHISNTNKQLALYNALGATPPRFAHIPLILAPDKSRLSKRFGAVSISEYKQRGYLPEAMVNYLALLGWAPGDNKEFMDIKEIIRRFDLKRVNKRGAEFNEDKLRWLNGEYIKRLDIDRFIELAKDFMGIECDPEWLKKVAELYKPRVKTLVEFKEEVEMFLKEEISYDEEAVEKFLKNKEILDILKIALERLKKIQNFTAGDIEETMRALIGELNIKPGDLIHPLRVAVTGRTVSAGIFELLSVMGKDIVIKRLEKVLLWRRKEDS